MSLSNLQDDLIQEFRAERYMVDEQLEILDPLATSLRRPAAQRLISNGALVILEIFCYLVAAGGVAFMFFMDKIYPFYLLSDMLYLPKYRNEMGAVNVSYLNIAIYGLVALSAILFIIIAGNVRRIRLKNNILSVAGRDMKIVVGQILKRKAAIDAIEQRHFIDMSGLSTSTIIEKPTVNQVPNPGFDNSAI